MDSKAEHWRQWLFSKEEVEFIRSHHTFLLRSLKKPKVRKLVISWTRTTEAHDSNVKSIKKKALEAIASKLWNKQIRKHDCPSSIQRLKLLPKSSKIATPEKKSSLAIPLLELRKKRIGTVMLNYVLDKNTDELDTPTKQGQSNVTKGNREVHSKSGKRNKMDGVLSTERKPSSTKRRRRSKKRFAFSSAEDSDSSKDEFLDFARRKRTKVNEKTSIRQKGVKGYIPNANTQKDNFIEEHLNSTFAKRKTSHSSTILPQKSKSEAKIKKPPITLRITQSQNNLKLRSDLSGKPESIFSGLKSLNTSSGVPNQMVDHSDASTTTKISNSPNSVTIATQTVPQKITVPPLKFLDKHFVRTHHCFLARNYRQVAQYFWSRPTTCKKKLPSVTNSMETNYNKEEKVEKQKSRLEECIAQVVNYNLKFDEDERSSRITIAPDVEVF